MNPALIILQSLDECRPQRLPEKTLFHDLNLRSGKEHKEQEFVALLDVLAVDGHIDREANRFSGNKWRITPKGQDALADA